MNGNYTNYEAQIQQAIPAEFHMISGSHDSQTSADVSNVVGRFNELPNPAGRAGGACTSALLQVLYRQNATTANAATASAAAYNSNYNGNYTNGNNHNTAPTTTYNNISWVQLLRQMRTELLTMGFDQVPQLTSSRMIDVNKPMEIVPSNNASGRRRAVLIGINYVGQQGQLSGCHNDVRNIKKYLIEVQGFQESEMLILCDDGRCHAPTRKNIEDAFRRIVQYSQAGDVVFVHYSGHGGRVRDTSGDEEDGYDETLIPVDFRSAGQIVDDDLLKILVTPMRAGVNVTVLMDCCHSGTVLDLPYRFSADDSQMRLNQGFHFGNFGDSAPAAVVCCACLALMLLDGL